MNKENIISATQALCVIAFLSIAVIALVVIPMRIYDAAENNPRAFTKIGTLIYGHPYECNLGVAYIDGGRAITLAEDINGNSIKCKRVPMSRYEFNELSKED